jgi:hypothetical protein
MTLIHLFAITTKLVLTGLLLPLIKVMEHFDNSYCNLLSFVNQDQYYTCGLYYKSFTIEIYVHNDSILQNNKL